MAEDDGEIAETFTKEDPDKLATHTGGGAVLLDEDEITGDIDEDIDKGK